MTIVRLVFSALMLMTFLPAALACTSGTASSELPAAIEARVQETIDRQSLVGTQYAVLHRGEWIAEGCLGLSNIDAGSPVRQETLFLIASLTKPMTVAVTMRLAEQGIIDLEAPVTAYLPDFPVHDSGTAPTLQQLISHTGGIRHYDREAGEPTLDVLNTHYPTAQDALTVFIDAPYARAPGEAFVYTSYGYALLAAALEAATGETFTALLQRDVFDAAGMDHASVPDMRFPIPGMTATYSFYDWRTAEEVEEMRRARLNDYSYNPGGGNVIANARAIARFGAAHFNADYLGGTGWARLVTDDYEWRDIREGNTYVRDIMRQGWLVSHDTEDRLMLLATGASEAYQAGLLVYPEEELVIALLSNTWGRGSRDGSFTLVLPEAIGRLVLEVE